MRPKRTPPNSVGGAMALGMHVVFLHVFPRTQVKAKKFQNELIKNFLNLIRRFKLAPMPGDGAAERQLGQRQRPLERLTRGKRKRQLRKTVEMESGLRGVWRESEPNGKMVERGLLELERGSWRLARECLGCARRAKRRAHRECAVVDSFVSSFTPCVAPADRAVRANCSLHDPCTLDISHDAHSARSVLHNSLNS